MSSYKRAAKSLSKRQRRAIRATLVRWSRNSSPGREIVRNIDPLERFLPSDNMKQILTVIYEARNERLDRLEALYASECYKHVRTGGKIRCPAPIAVGRAVEKEVFIEYLRKLPYFGTAQAAEDFVKRLVKKDSLSKGEASQLMSAYSGWVTWDDSTLGPDPFCFARSAISAEIVRASLGLDPDGKWRGKPLLLLVYRSSDLDLYRPTVADAGLYLFFEPPPSGLDAHGLTKPRPPGMNRPISGLQPRPEAVHGPCTFKLLQLPVEEVN
jgi:hypothetical protein